MDEKTKKLAIKIFIWRKVNEISWAILGVGIIFLVALLIKTGDSAVVKTGDSAVDWFNAIILGILVLMLLGFVGFLIYLWLSENWNTSQYLAEQQIEKMRGRRK